MTAKRWAIGMAGPDGRISYRYTVGDECELIPNVDASPERAAARIGEAYPNATALRRFLYGQHARRQLETARDLPGYVSGAVLDASCDIALLHTTDGYVGWRVASERTRRLRERCAWLLAQASTSVRDYREGLERAGGRRDHPWWPAIGDAGKLLEQARLVALRSDRSSRTARQIWLAQEKLEGMPWPRRSKSGALVSG